MHTAIRKMHVSANLAFLSDDPDAYKFTPSWSDQRVYELKTNKVNDDLQSRGVHRCTEQFAFG